MSERYSRTFVTLPLNAALPVFKNQLHLAPLAPPAIDIAGA
jgi:hypothetical protein